MIRVFTDGGSRGNPGPSAYGFVVKSGGVNVKEEGGYLGIETNNFAEYTALIRALMWLADNFAGEAIECFMDSQLVASQLNGTYKVKSPKIRLLFDDVKRLEVNFAKIVYKHIPREQNKEADKLVNMALDKNIWN